MTARLSYDLSCARLRELGLLDADSHPPTPERLPQCGDDGPLGVSFFRTRLADGLELSNLTLPRTFFGRSEVNRVSFRACDLRESNLCWNDFIGTDFTGADLSRSDLRSSLFQHVLFVTTDLSGADLRRSFFTNCDFKDAAMKGAVLARRQADAIRLSSTQRQNMDWRDDDGSEPDGG